MTISSRPSVSERHSSSFDLLSEPVRRWIWNKGWDELRDIQERAIPALISETADVIIAAATAGGKTEAAFLPIISQIAGPAPRGFRALYVSPLKALINDQFRRLDDLCEAVELPVHRWHGDVSAASKSKARRNPGGIVLITPESLEALFVRRGAEIAGLFAPLEIVVIDELHAFMGQERGAQLQSLLHRLEVVLGRAIRRVGLSATIGDLALAKQFLRPGGADVVVLQSQSDAQTLQLQLRGYQKEEALAEAPHQDQQDAAPEDESKTGFMRSIAEHIFGKLRGRHSLIFAGSRGNVELYADLLRRQTERLGVPEEFYPHHANLSRMHREFVENRLRDGNPPTSAVCTSTLELGIDIGAIESVAQIGAPWSVAGLRQRLGRSGRRGDPAVIRLYIAERAWRHDLHPADALRCELVQAIAMVRLLVSGWCEPPNQGALHLSTLVHQTLALIAQYGGVTAAQAYRILCSSGPFSTVESRLFATVLHCIGAPDCKLIEQSPDGTLLLGEIGERVVESHDFYAVFQTPEEYSVLCDGKELGTLPIVTVIAPGMTIIFSGRRWQVCEVDDPAKTILVVPSGAGIPPLFGGEGAELHDIVVTEMRRVYESPELPPFLDAKARALLAEGRRAYEKFGLREGGVFEEDGTTYLFPWAGTRACGTLAIALKQHGLAASERGILIEVERTPLADVSHALKCLARAPVADGVNLALMATNLVREKYDRFLARPLLARGFAVEHLEPARIPTMARNLISVLEGQYAL